MSNEYFIYPLIQELKETTDPERIKFLRERIAVNISDPDVLMAITGGPDLRDFYHTASGSTVGKEDPINAFIARFGSGPAPDSLQDILEPKPERKKKPKVKPETNRAESALPDEAVIKSETSESLMDEVKILVKKHEYERALAIMTHFYLNNPKKSVYFADQIRFIKKMMLNERKKTQ